MEEEMVKELAKKYNKKENLVRIMWESAKKYGYNIIKFQAKLREFYALK